MYGVRNLLVEIPGGWWATFFLGVSFGRFDNSPTIFFFRHDKNPFDLVRARVGKVAFLWNAR